MAREGAPQRGNVMRMTYDKELDFACIQLDERAVVVARTLYVDDVFGRGTIAVKFDRDSRIVAIEVMQAQTRINADALAKAVPARDPRRTTAEIPTTNP